MNNNELINLATAAKEKSYSPYSSFRVGAALLTKDGKVYQGANIENAAYGVTMCAERIAVFTAKLEGETEFSAIAITSDSKDYIPPCGSCRQVLLELCGEEIDVLITNGIGEVKIFKLKDLLPFSFGDKNLNG
ncbi:MAG: cytidine deaminase [Bacteroidetes bacterium]|nr:cytidine deaminase [Bacteroidota bacterium]MBU1114609.1 cytidine deaminase [Bacteroidota bacterium]MBU1797821.1 cytidine deaminase [Bacteroidota bacterium]